MLADSKRARQLPPSFRSTVLDRPMLRLHGSVGCPSEAVLVFFGAAAIVACFYLFRYGND
jgi:hypothetical protein